jgi:ABC-type transport system substrate-binding protein
MRGLSASLGLGLLAACTTQPPAPAATPAASPAAAPRPPAVPSPVVALPSPGAAAAALASAAASPSPSPDALARSPTRPEGGEVALALPGQPETLDPANALTLAAEAAGRPLYDTLLELGPGGELRPALAERWEVSDDGLRIRLALRKGVLFHDGTSFNATAAQYNLERLLGDERPRRRELLLGIVRLVRAVDDATLELSLERPYSGALHQLAQYGAAMVSPQAHRANPQELAKRPAGTGPFRFKEVRGDRLVLERFEACWRGRAALDRVQMTGVPDESARTLLLESGEFGLASLTAELLPRVEAHPLLKAEAAPSARALGIAIHTQIPPLNDRRVRQALNVAVDRAALAQAVYRGHATPLGGAVGPGVRGGSSPQPYPFDPARAKALLAQAGYPGGLELPLLGSRGRYPRDSALMSELHKQLTAAGFKLRLELLDQSGYTLEVTRASDETTLRLSLMGWLPPSLEARGALFPLFHSSQWVPKGQNTSFFKNSQLDDLLERAGRALEPRDGERLYRQAQELLHDEAPWIFLLSPKLIVGHAATLHEPRVLANEVVTVSERTWIEP